MIRSRIRSRIIPNNMDPGSSYDPDALAYFSQLTGTIPDSFKIAVNKWFLSEKANGNFSKYMRAILHATPNRQNATIYLNNPTATPASEVNMPSWTQYRGYKGDGLTSYLKSNYIPSLDPSYQLNSASIGVYSLDDIDEFSNDIGVLEITNNGFLIMYTMFLGNLTGYVNTGFSTAHAAGDSLGYSVSERTNNTTQNLYKNGSLVSTDMSNSEAIPDMEVYFGARNNSMVMAADNFSTRRIAFRAITSGAIDQAGAYTSLQQLAVDLGFNV